MRKIIISVLVSAVLTVGIIIINNLYFSGKIGYVKTGLILQDYKGMINVNDQFNKEVAVVKANIDTLRLRYEKIRSQENTIPKSQQKEWEYKVNTSKNEFENYSSRASEQMQLRQQELTKQVIDKINTFIQEYGKNNNYKLILGTTNDGSILYGAEADDLTKIIIEHLNEDFNNNNGKEEPKTDK